MTNAESLFEQIKRLVEHLKRIERIRDNHPEWSLMAMQLGITTDKFIDSALHSVFIDSEGNLSQDAIDGDLSSKEATEMLNLAYIILKKRSIIFRPYFL